MAKDSFALVPVSGTDVQKQNPEEEESPTDDLATGMAVSALLTAMGVPGPIVEGVDVGHHLGEALHQEPSQGDVGESVNINPGALRPESRLRPR